MNENKTKNPRKTGMKIYLNENKEKEKEMINISNQSKY